MKCIRCFSLLFSSILVFLCCSCSSSIAMIEKGKPAVESRQEAKRSPIRIVHKPQNITVKRDKSWKRRGRKKVDRGLGLKYSKKLFNFWIKYFSVKQRQRFIRYLGNGDKFHKVIMKILASHDMPEDLFYVALIESGLYTHTNSRSSATGPWQFIKGTARRYGLRVDKRVDERRSIYKSTEAAARYFKDLYNIFGRWELALCAYNAGEYKIINAIRRGNTRNYQQLVRKGLLPKETAYYVSKVAAAKELYNNRVKYRLPAGDNGRQLYDSFQKITLRSSFYVRDILKKTGMSLNLFRKLNPDLTTRWISVNKRKGFALYLQNQTQAKKIASLRSAPKRSKTKAFDSYTVKKGDNLISIAKKYGITVKDILRYNSLKSTRIYPKQKLNIPVSI